MFKRIIVTAAALTATLAASSASAFVITASNAWNGLGSTTSNGVTVSACNVAMAGACTSPGVIGTRDIPGVGVGAGVQGQGNNEIDWYSTGARTGNSEMLRFTFGTASVIDSLQLGLLFNGPEYTDVQERAEFRVTYAGGATSTYSLTALYLLPGITTPLNWNGYNSWTGTGLTEGGSGLWSSLNPFGNRAVTQIDLFAGEGRCPLLLSCNDQSDFLFRSLSATAVPEPGTLALLGAGLLGMGLMARRRRAAV